MWRDPYGRSGVVEWLVSVVLVLFILVLAVEAFLLAIAPFLPWIGFAVVMALGLGAWFGRLDRW